MNSEDYDTIINACLGYYNLGRRTFVSYRNGLTKAQSMVMNMLLYQDGLSMKALGERIRISKEQLSRVVTTLEERNLVKRERPQENKRIVRVFLTEAGQEFLELQFRGITQLIDECLSGLSEDEKQSLVDAAKSSTNILRKALGEDFESDITGK